MDGLDCVCFEKLFDVVDTANDEEILYTSTQNGCITWIDLNGPTDGSNNLVVKEHKDGSAGDSVP